MELQDKTNEALINELLELQEENTFLKELCDKEHTLRNCSDEALRETNIKLTSAMKGANMAWWEMDVPTGNVTFDKRKVEMLGYLPENFRHYKDFTALVHPKDYERIMNAMRGHLEGTLDKYEAEYRILANSGEYIWFYDYGSVVKRDANGIPLICTGFVFNITDKKKAEEKFHLISRAVESTSDAIAISDSLGHHYYHNKALSNLFGYETAEELKASGGGMAIVKDPAIAKKMVGTILHGKSLSGELEMVTKSGRVFPAYGRADAITDKEGNIIGIIGIIKDITDQKQAEKVLGDIIEKNPISIQIMDKDGFTLKVNPAHFLLFGPPPPPDFSMFEELRNKGLGEYILLAKNGEVVHFPDIYYNVHDAYAGLPDKPLWIRAVLLPLTDPDGIPERFIFMHQDITQRKLAEEKLRENENKLQAIFDTVGAGILIIDKESKRIIEANETTLKMTGLSKEQILNHICHSLVCSAEVGKCPVKDLGENIEESERKLLCADGQIKDILKTVYPISIKGRDCYLESFIDITERRKAEKALRESEERYRTIFENSTIGIYRTTPEGQILLVNPTLIKLLGYSSFEELADRNLEKDGFEPSYERSHFMDVLKKEGEVKGLESAWTKMDGTTLFIRESARAFKDKEGKIIYYDGVIEDITQRRQTEEKLKKSEKMLQTILDNFPGVVFWKDRQSCYLGCNQSFATTVGLKDPAEIVGKIDFDLPWTSEETINYIKDDLAVMESGKARFHIIERLRHSNGQLNWIDTSKLPLKDSRGEVIGVVGVSHDISLIKKVEQELIISNKELHCQNEEKDKLALELVSALAKKEASDNLKTAFMNNLSHEIRTPLNGILGFVPFVFQDDITIEEKEELMEILKLSSNRLMNTLDNYIDLSLIMTDNMEVNTKPVNVSSMLTNIVANFRESCMKKNLEIKMQFPKNHDQFILNTDGEILHKAISNLVDNAVKFTKKGSITLEFELTNNTIEIIVKDTGKGIGNDFLDIVFERFMQEDVSNKREEDGSGLGLTIAKEMIQLLGGKIRLESTKHIGTSVFLTVPNITSTASY